MVVGVRCQYEIGVVGVSLFEKLTFQQRFEGNENLVIQIARGKLAQ